MKSESIFKHLKERIRPQWMKTISRLARSRIKLEAVTRLEGLLPISGNPLGRIKSSSTIFILGSGASIATLSQAEWQTIRLADSVGFNFWPIHDFIPSLYVAEVSNIREGQEENYNRYRKLMKAREQDYILTPIVIKDGERVKSTWLREYISHFPKNLRKNIALSWDWEIPDEDVDGFAASLQRWERCLFNSQGPLVRKRASVFYLVLMALRAGYREIVLCGVDLDNNDYFYHVNEAEYQEKGRPVPQPVYATAAIHKTDNVSLGNITLSRALDILNQEILLPHGIQLKVALRSSRLYPTFPDYFGH